jgi:hypothetical protein
MPKWLNKVLFLIARQFAELLDLLYGRSVRFYLFSFTMEGRHRKNFKLIRNPPAK